MTDFSGSTVPYAYNNAGESISATDSGGTIFAASGAYAAPGLLTGMTQGASSLITVANSFTKMLQPGVLSAATTATTLYSLSYSFGAAGSNNGNVTQIANNLNSARSQVFTYDQLNRLSSALAGTTTWGNTYTYDPWGNLTNKNPVTGESGENMSMTVNPLTNQLTGNDIHGSAMQYDLAGNQTHDNLGNLWAYDAEGRPLTVGTYTYVYDGDGNRVEKSGASSRLYWPGPAGMNINESDTAGNNVTRNIYFNGQYIARMDSTGHPHYLTQDQIDSTRVSIGSTGTREDDTDYYPWGAPENGAPTSGNLYTFTGDESDTESTTYHTSFRQLSPSLGRWLRPDPYDGSYDLTNPQSLNRYSYVRNIPLRYSDSLGLSPCYDSGTGDTRFIIESDGADDPCDDFGWEGSGGDGSGGDGGIPVTCYVGQQCDVSGGQTNVYSNPCAGIDDCTSGTPGSVFLVPGVPYQNLPPTLNPVKDLVPKAFAAYKACRGTLNWPGWGNVHGSLPTTGGFGPGSSPADMGVAPGESAPDVGPLNLYVSLARAKGCLRKNPLAALDPEFNDIAPADSF